MEQNLVSVLILVVFSLQSKYPYFASGVPTILKTIGNITVNYCTIIKKEIPRDSYSETSGQNITLKLLSASNFHVESNWPLLNLDAEQWTLYAVPSSQSRTQTKRNTEQIYYKIRVENPVTNSFVDDGFWLILTGSEDVNLRNFGYEIENKILIPSPNDVTLLYTYVEKIYKFFNEPTTLKTIQIYDYIILSDGRINVHYQNCTIREDPCDDGNTQAILKKLNSDAFGASLLPEFNMTALTANRLPPCNTDNLGPGLTSDWFYALYAEIPTLDPKFIVDPYPGIFRWDLPRFFSKEETSETFFKSQLLLQYPVADSIAPRTFWANTRDNFTTQVNTLYVTVTDDTYNFPVHSYTDYSGSYKIITLTINAIDKRNRDSDWTPGLFMVKPTPRFSYYSIRFNFINFQTRGTDLLALQAQHFLNTTIAALGEQYRTYIFLNSMTVNSTSLTGSALWSVRVYPGCNFTIIRNVQSIMFDSTSQKQISASFKQSLSSLFDLVSLTEYFQDRCKIEPPTQMLPFPDISIPVCGIFTYQIPEDMFHDNQDGNTRNLTLTLLNKNNQEVRKSSWVNLDQITQTIYAIVPVTMASQSFLRKSTYKLKVTDSSGQSYTTDINLIITGTASNVAYKISVKGIYTAGKENYTVSYFLAQKVTHWVGNNGSTYSLQENAVTSQQENFLTFSTCEWRYEPCDAVKIAAYRNRFFDPVSGLVRQDFVVSLLPEFQSVTVMQTITGPCQNDNQPEVNQPWGPLSMSSCATFSQQVPKNTFIDAEDGDTRLLAINLTGITPAPLELPAWIYFDKETQTVNAVPYTSLTLTNYVFQLTAFDINKKSASQSIQINIPNVGSSVSSPSHIVEMFFSVKTNDVMFVKIYSKLRNRLTDYLRESSDVIQYITMTTGSMTVLRTKWSHCQISKTVCEKNKIDLLKSKLLFNGNPSPSLVQSLNNEFTIQSVTFSLSGICVDEQTNPIVTNPIPNQHISYCGYQKFKVPENTFSDKIDGGTRNLQLSARYKSSLSLPKWMAFDVTNQEFLIVLQSDKPVEENTTEIQLTATTNRKLSVTTTLKFKLQNNPVILGKSLKFIVNVRIPGYISTLPTSLISMYINFLKTVGEAFAIKDKHLHYYKVYPSEVNYMFAQIVSCGHTNCTLEEISNLELPLTRAKYDKSKFDPDFSPPLPILDGKINCLSTKKPPKVIQNIPPFIASRCRAFRVEITKEVVEYEDDLAKLNFIIKTINNAPLNPQKAWIYMDKQFITGVVTHSVLQNNIKYNVTIGIADSDEFEVATWVEITISGNQAQLFYQYVTQFEDKDSKRSLSISPGLSRQIDVVKKINNYFEYDIVNIVNYKDMINNRFSLTWSVCPLPNKCTDTGLTESEKRMFNAGQPKAEFANAFSSTLGLEIVEKKVSPFCTGPLNPPTAAQDPFTAKLPYCGGFRYVIPKYLFNDAEDGDTRTLKLYFETVSGEDVSKAYSWMMFDQSSQELKGLPHYIEAKIITETKQKFHLRAKDNSGLDKTIIVYLEFDLPEQPKFYLTISLSLTFDAKLVQNGFMFIKKMAQFRNAAITTIGVRSTKRTTLNKEIEYFNCSTTYSPCDLFELRKMKSEFSDENGFPTTQFRDFMKPEFSVDYVHSSVLSPCGDPYPPVVKVHLPVFNLSLCGMYQYLIPSNTFYDTEQGYTRNLNLALAPQAGSSSFQMASFVKFMASTQTMLIIPNANLLSTRGSNAFKFSLTATDNTNLAAVTTLHLNIIGPYSILEECKIELTLTHVSAKTTTQSNVDIIRYIIERLSVYFQVSTQEIGVIKFTKISSTTFIFSWSYCSTTYQTKAYMANGFGLPVDYYNLQTKVLMKLFESQQKVNTNFASIFNNVFKVERVHTRFSGRCRDLPPIATPGHSIIYLNLQFGGYAVHRYKNNYFYDYEDGGTFSLKLSFLTSTNQTVLIDYWINIDYKLNTIFAIVTDLVRMTTASSAIFKYNFIATDSAGQSAVILIQVQKYTTIFGFSPFNITYALQYDKGTSLIYARQAKYLIDVITSYFTTVTSLTSVLVRWYKKSPGYPQYRIFTFSVANQGCSSKVLAKIKMAYTQEILDASLISSVSEMFTLRRVYNESFCSTVPDPPSPVDPLPAFNITYCRVWTYNLPRTLFHDIEDGETIALKLSLLNSQGHTVSPSSWFQFNTVTRQFYAVAIKSVLEQQTTFSYSIQASNSRRKSSRISFQATLHNTPYTSDCIMTMNFQYKFMTENIVDLDIIRTFISKISVYYGDSSETYVKVLNFIKYTDSYNISWSNCSFAFSTLQQANSGLTENNRVQISSIFSKVVTSSNQVVPKFRTFMSSHFEIRGLVVNYNCIEEPPIPNNNGYRVFPKFCQLFNDSVPRTAFYDKRDGHTRNLKLKLLDKNENEVTIDNWLQLDERQNVYGVVTEKIKDEAPLSGYKYYIQATDSSGRSAKISYIVKVASPRKFFDVYFRTGFINNYGLLAPSAKMLYTFVEKLSKYIDSNDMSGKIYVKQFDYPSSITWSHCSLEQCTNKKVQAILSKLKTTSGSVTTEFVHHLSKEFTPQQQEIETKNAQCGSMSMNITVHPPPPNITLPGCGVFRFRIRESLFSDLILRNTRFFYLNFLNVDNTPVDSTSWIRLYGPGQYLYGINILSRTTVTSTYRIQAVLPESGYTAYTSAIFNVGNYQSLKSIITSLCWTKFDMMVRYNPQFDDVSILELFMKIISAYVGSTISQVQIYNYTRTTDSYPFRLTVTWTNCSMTTLFIRNPFSEVYYSSVNSTLQRFLNVSGSGNFTNMLQSVQQYFSQNSLFTLSSITTSGSCIIPDKTPPKPVKSVVFEIQCGMFQYQIPADTFSDKEDGNTRQLTLVLLESDGSTLSSTAFLVLNQSQFLLGMIKNETILTSTTGEYKYMLQATDTSGMTATTTITVKVPRTGFSSTVMKLSLFVMRTATFNMDIIPQLLIINGITKTMVKESNAIAERLNLYVTVFRKTGPNFLVQIENCDTCDSMVNIRLDQLKKKVNLLNAELPPGLRIMVVSTASNSLDLDKFCGVPFASNNNKVKIPYCGNDTFKYDLRVVELDEIVNYRIEFPSPSNPGLTPTSWIWLNNYTFEFFPTVSQWQQKPNFEETYGYSVLYPSGVSTGRLVKNTFILVKNKEYETVDYKIVLQESGGRTKSMDNYYISMVLNAVTKLIGNGVGIHFVSFRVLKNNPFRFEVKWENCTLPKDCSDTNIRAINDILFSSPNLQSLSIKKFLSSSIEILELDNKCKNTPPHPGPPLYLVIPVCGKFEYKLPDNITYDVEDKVNLQTSMTLYDGSELPRRSWVQYNPTTRTIYAFAFEEVLLIPQRRRYLLWFEDSKGLRSNLTVNVDVKPNENVNYQVKITFRYRGPDTTSYLDIVCKMLLLISEYTTGQANLSNYRVMTVTQAAQVSSETYVLKYGLCSINQTLCEKENEKILKIESNLFTSDGNVKNAFKRYVSRFFDQITTIQREPKNLRVDSSPKIIRELDVIILDACQSKVVDISTVFVDEDTNLQHVLKFKNQSDVPSTFWVQTFENKIYINPWPNITVGYYNFTLTAQDSCGNMQSIPVIVYLRNVYGRKIGSEILFGYTWTLRLTTTTITTTTTTTTTTTSTNANTSPPDVYYVYIVKDRMVRYVTTRSGHQSSIQVISYTINGNTIKIRFGECNIEYLPCDKLKVNQLSTTLFPSGNSVISPDIKQVFVSIGEVTVFFGTLQQTCGTPPGSPQCEDRLTFNVSYCKVLRFVIPLDLCKDTRNMKFDLFTFRGESLSNNPLSWLQFTSADRLIYGYPFLTENTKLPSSEFFLLRIENKDQKTTFITVVANFPKENYNLDYRLKLTGTLSQRPGISQVDERICIGTKLAEYFDRSDVSNSVYNRTGEKISFQWSFCKQKNDPCECGVIRDSQRLLNGYNNRASFAIKMLDCSVSFNNVDYTLLGECDKTEGPQRQDSIKNTEITLGQFYEKTLSADMFYDKEDGGIVNMTLYITDINDQRLYGAIWVRVEDEKLCGLMAYKEFIRQGYTTDNVEKYKMVATDSCGKTSSSNFDIIYRNMFPTLFYRIIFIMSRPYGDQNCATIDGILTTISIYSEVPKSDIFVQDFRNSSNGTYMEWGIRRFTGKNCDNKEYEIYREKFVKDGKGNEIFVQRMKNDGHELIDIYDNTDIKCHAPFPWWILILVLVFLLLFLLLWCCWFLIPRCCSQWCGRTCPGCTQCCTKGGDLSSMRDDGHSDNDAKDGVGYGDDDIRSPATYPPQYPTANKRTDDLDIIDVGRFLDNSKGTGIDNLKTESWTDKRSNIWDSGSDNEIYRGVSNRYFLEDNDDHRDSKFISDNSAYYKGSNRKLVDNKQYYKISDRGHRSSQNIQDHRESYHNSAYRNDYHKDAYRNDERIYIDRNHDKRVPVNQRQPLAIRIRRGDLREYLQKQGKQINENVHISERDLNELIQQNARMKVYRTENYENTANSRLADALVDHNVVRRHQYRSSDGRANRRFIRRHSAESISEYGQPSYYRHRSQYYRPTDIHLRAENDLSSTPYETYTDSSAANEHLYMVDSNYFKDRSNASSSSQDDMIITPIQSIPMYKRRLTRKGVRDGRYQRDISYNKRYTAFSNRRSLPNIGKSSYTYRYDESSV